MNFFIELLQVALGTREKMSRVLDVREWMDLLDEASKQALVGVMLCGVERLPVEQLPPKKAILMQWIGLAQMIEFKNQYTTKACVNVCRQFEKNGFKTCVLKGQANHRYYPEEMRKRRSCGDVDVWVVPNECSKNPVKKVLNYVKGKYGLTGLCWLHCNFNEGEVPVEVHFHPSYMNEPCKNRKFLQLFEFRRCVVLGEVDGEVLPVMRVNMDVIFQMSHIYRHLLDEGVGMRQIVDYYYVLRRYREECFSQGDASSHVFVDDSLIQVIRNLGMMRFATALMWVLHTVCCMPLCDLLCNPSEKEGRFLLEEIITSGNFGQADPRMAELNTSSVSKRRISQAWRRFKRNMRFLTFYPEEVVWEPFARLFHFTWKALGLWK